MVPPFCLSFSLFIMNSIMNSFQIKKCITIAFVVLCVNVCYGQKIYSEPQKSYKNGALAETYSNEKLQITVSASVEKVFNNAKEIFYNIIVIPKVNDITLLVNNIKAYRVDKDKEKELTLYDYQSYKTKLKRNILFWGPNPNTTKTITSDVKSQTNGTLNQNSNFSGSIYDNGTATTTSVRANENSQTNYNQNTNVKVTTQVTEPNPIFYETNKDAELFVEGYLKSNTVNIGEIINGFVVSKLSNSKFVKMTIPIGDDIYSFLFEF